MQDLIFNTEQHENSAMVAGVMQKFCQIPKAL
jgi:hypothetical protein